MQRCITNNYPVTIIRIKLTEHLHPHYLLDCKYLAMPNSHPLLHLPKLLFDGPIDAALTIALAHGAGLSKDAPFMTQVASGLAERGLRVARFNFPYMDKIEETGKRRPPDRPPILMQTWRNVIAEIGAKTLIISGKSLGGRIASLVADEAGVLGLSALGYPFHPTGKPGKTRTAHLATLQTPTLICQGTRDLFGTLADVSTYNLSPAIRLHWLEDGDHGFKPRKVSGRTEIQNVADAIAALTIFAKELETMASG